MSRIRGVLVIDYHAENDFGSYQDLFPVLLSRKMDAVSFFSNQNRFWMHIYIAHTLYT